MGGSRKHRGSQQQQQPRRGGGNHWENGNHSNQKHVSGGHHNNHNNHHSASNSPNHNKNSNSNNDGSFEDYAMKPNSNLDFNKVLQEVEGSFQVTWKEILLVLVSIFLLAVLSICVGIAAGMTISIHYYESQGPATRRLDARDTSSLYNNGPNAYRRVTTLDPSIASSNVLQRDREGLDLGKVITTSASGQLNVLMVVEETAPLHIDQSATEGYTNDVHNSNDTTHSTSETKMHHDYNNHDNYYESHKTSPYYSLKNNRNDASHEPIVRLRESTILPSLCSDGETIGFSTWQTLKDAVQEANAISAERFMKWNEYFAKSGKTFAAFDDDSYYYEEDVLFTICPDTVLRARRGPIFINAENVLIECEGCTVDVGGTHMAFGPHAKNVLVRGITFKGARTSSLTFFHDGAEASFEDCFWVGNSGVNAKYGAVADVNSTSTVNFYRCEIGQGRKAYGGMAPGFASSLSIRA